MRHFIAAILVSVNLLVVSSCGKGHPPPQGNKGATVQDNTSVELNSQESPAKDYTQQIVEGNELDKQSVFNLFVDDEQKSLSYGGYTILNKIKKTVDKVDGRQYPQSVKYLLLKRGGKVIRKFDDNYLTSESSQFGLFNFLGGNTKQLIVAQISTRTGRFWVVRLIPEYRILFDSDKYGGSRDEIWIDDIDKDGVYELKVFTFGCTSIGTTFNLYSTPQPMIIFKYSRKADKYLPANFLFQDYERKEIEQTISRLQPTSEKPTLTDNQSLDEGPYFREMTEVFLQYVYARRERDAWAFFDRFYNLPDKNKVKSSIRAALRRDKIYRLIYSKRATR